MRARLTDLKNTWYDFLQQSAASGALEQAVREVLGSGPHHESLSDIISRFTTSNFQDVPRIELLQTASMQGAMGAYSASTKTIYINSDWLSHADPKEVLRVLTEELGHHLDSILNISDTKGDEGELIASLLFDTHVRTTDLDRMAGENDLVVIIDAAGQHLLAEAANLTGGEGNDVLIGTRYDDIIIARGGNDLLDGGAGNDRLETGQGNDTSYGRDGNDEVWVGVHADRTLTRQIVDAGAGDDFVALFANISNDSLIRGGSGEDIINTTSNSSDLATRDSLISGFERWDDGSGRWLRLIDQNFVGTTDQHITVYYDGGGYGGYEAWTGAIPTSLDESSDFGNLVDASAVTSGRVSVIFNSGNSYGAFRGGAGSDSLIGSAGGDFFAGSGGNDLFDGRDGVDTAIFFGKRSDYIVTEIRYNTFTVRDLRGADGTDTLVDVNVLRFADGDVPLIIRGLTVTGNSTNEQFTGSQHSDYLDGAGGNDLLNGAAGNDLALGGAGNDTLNGQAGNDFLEGGAGNDRLYGQDGNDEINAGAGDDFIIGGDGKGNDIYRGGVGIDTVTYRSSLDNAVIVDLLVGTASGHEIGYDRLSGIENAIGGSQGDRLIGSAVGNSLSGMSGNDMLTGGAGNDTLLGGDGNDRLLGGMDVDRLLGGMGADFLDGGFGVDRLNGGAGNDTLAGGAGNDALLGGLGHDRMTGGSGKDQLTGGFGADQFQFTSWRDSGAGPAGRDVITDLNRAQGDKINLSVMDANLRLSGNQAFEFIGTDGFSGSAGELRYQQNSGTVLISADLNGDGKADFSIEVSRQIALHEHDFFL